MIKDVNILEVVERSQWNEIFLIIAIIKALRSVILPYHSAAGEKLVHIKQTIISSSI